ncbi:MAG TPA: radical SAM family heme chaperone HemW [Gemmatimonadales bacterium]|nr:radical SAM family heme chaperone HemW [Gemmatimonadales bacterium]
MHHLYIHVPFCQRRCSYCDFSIAVRKQIPARDFVDVILKEAGGHALNDLDTIYFGGGTPSLLPPAAIELLLRTTHPSLRSGQAHVRRTDVEVTVEANPEDVTVEHAKAWREAGINRVSLGAQSFDDNVLKWMHRSHDAAQTHRAVQALRDAGIENISLDLIFGLPEELNRDWDKDLELALALRTTHLSLYGLTVEPRTPLDRWISRGATHAPDEDRYAEEYLTAHKRLSAVGYQFYEVSNASLPGYRSRHNSAYWSGRPYVGLGPAAHSFDGRTRRWNLRAWEAYRRAVAEGRSAVESEETLTEEQRGLEAVYLGLRSSDGIAVGTGSIRAVPGWLEVRDGRLKCTPEGWLRLDSLVTHDSSTH